MGSETIRVGIIGTGQIGQQHIRRYRDIPAARLVAVADVDPKALAAGLAEAGEGVDACDNFRTLLARDDIDAVDVCLHNNLHAPVSIAALEAGKHVFCEKPMAGSYADAHAMCEAAKRTGRRLGIQLGRLFLPETKAAKRLVDAGTLGRIYFARSVGFRRRGRCYVDGYGSTSFVRKQISAGGALADLGVYNISRMLYLMGNPAPRTISGATYQEIDMYPARKAESGYDVEEFALGFVRLDGGVTLQVQESWAIHLGSLGSLALVGHKAGLSFEPLTVHRTEADLETDAAVQVELADKRLHLVDPDYWAYDSPQRHWIGTLVGAAREPIDTAALALNTMLVSEGIYLSQKLGREVAAEQVMESSVSTAVAV